MIFHQASRYELPAHRIFIVICFQQEIEGSKYPFPIKVVDYTMQYKHKGYNPRGILDLHDLSCTS
jgi:hypothetical protein